MNRRTPPWKIQLRLFLLCLPFNLIIAFIFSKWFLTVLLSSCVTTILFWNFAHFISNGFCYVCDPEGYRFMKSRGCDPFYNSIGWPLNTDSEEVRMQGLVANSTCLGCQEPLYLEWNSNAQCSRCGCCWNQNQWWMWNGNEWIEIKSE